MPATVSWIALRLAFVVGFALFVLAMFDVLPGIFLLIGFGIYCIAISFWLYPKERLFPSDDDMATVDILLGARTKPAPRAKAREAKGARGFPPARAIPARWLSSFHLHGRKP